MVAVFRCRRRSRNFRDDGGLDRSQSRAAY